MFSEKFSVGIRIIIKPCLMQRNVLVAEVTLKLAQWLWWWRWWFWL